MIILKKELDEGMESSVSDTEMFTENQDSADVTNSKEKQVKNKLQDFVISSNQLPS